MVDKVMEHDAQIRTQSRSGMNTKRLIGVAALATIILAGGRFGYEWWTNGRFIETTDDAYVGGDVTALSPDISGFIQQVAVHDNETVRRGQLLIRLDPREYDDALHRAQSTLSERLATLANLQAQLTLQQSAIRQATAELNARTARAAFTAQDKLRYAALAAASAGSRQDAQKGLVVDQEAEFAVQAAQAALDAAQQRVVVLQTSIDAAQATIGQAQADVDLATLKLSYTEIRSPVDGVIGNRVARVGAYAAPGSYLLSVIPAHGLWVDANFKEDQLASITPGQPASLVADVAPGRVLHGHVLSIGPGTGATFSVIPPENATGNFTKIVQRVAVRIALDDTDSQIGTLRPGLSTTVSVDTRSSVIVK